MCVQDPVSAKNTPIQKSKPITKQIKTQTNKRWAQTNKKHRETITKVWLLSDRALYDLFLYMLYLFKLILLKIKKSLSQCLSMGPTYLKCLMHCLRKIFGLKIWKAQPCLGLGFTFCSPFTSFIFKHILIFPAPVASIHFFSESNHLTQKSESFSHPGLKQERTLLKYHSISLILGALCWHIPEIGIA